MAVLLKVNTVDKAGLVDWASVAKVEILTKEPDTLSFLIRNVAGKTYRPALSDDVKLYAFDGTTLLFGGIVVQTDETIEGGVRYFKVVVKDYTALLDRSLVSKSYTGMTAAAIIADLISTFTTGFTTVNVSAPFAVNAITFNYLTVSQCLQKLCDALPGYDWYPDYAKDIHFFLPSSVPAPFVIDDTSGNFNYDSLVFDQDSTQIQNYITIRGGQVAGTAVDNSQYADGVQRTFFVGYNLSSFLAYKALAASPTVFNILTVGRDGIDDPTIFNALYNPDRGLLIFPDASKPAVNDVVKYTGTPFFNLIVQMQDAASVATYGKYEALILDKTLTTQQAAQDRGTAQLKQYSQPLITGQFRTLVPGLVQGQTVSISCPSRGISGAYKITRITTRFRTPNATSADYTYDVEFASSKDITLIDVLNKLLITDPSDQIVIGSNEIVDRITSITEATAIGEVFASAKNVGTVAVLGAYTTNWAGGDVNRIFILDGSRLG